MKETHFTIYFREYQYMSTFFVILIALALTYLYLRYYSKNKIENFFGGECWCRDGISSGNTKAYTASLRGPWTSPNNTSTLTLGGGKQVWTVSGSAWSNAANASCKLNCVIDSLQTFSSTMWINPGSTHTTFPAMMFTTVLPAGSHTFSITLDGGASSCVSDVNDTVQLQVLEFPTS